MADLEQLALLRQGVQEWNKWRLLHPAIHPDLSDANLNNVTLNESNLSYTNLSMAKISFAILNDTDLTGADLSGADLSESNLSNANLSGAILSDANFFNANLSNAILSDANISGADLSGADLSDADLITADLYNVDFRNADLSGAIFSYADLTRADLSGADLSGADLNRAILSYTVLGNVDLRPVKGLEMVRHNGPSTIGTDTLVRSNGDIPEVFLRGAGLNDSFIEYARALVLKPVEYYTCFISYSSKDEAFVKRLHNDLQGEGVRCWYAPEDMKIGDKIRHRIDESIRVYDKLLIVLSWNSLSSTWVENEVETAFDKEQQRSTLVLFPIKLDETVMQTNQAWANTIRRTRHIGSFTQWNDHDCYQASFSRLLQDLKAEGR